MIVTAMLAWYDEDPEFLHRAVTSAAVIADRIVVADGRWQHYPGQDKASPRDQYMAIREAAMSAGLDLKLHLRHNARTWTGQVQKRNHLLCLAKGSDWVMPLDADWEIQGVRHAIRYTLENTTADSMVVPIYTPYNEDEDLATVAATSWHEDMAGGITFEPLIYRYLPSIQVDDLHWQYSGIKHGQRVALWGSHYPQASRQGLETIAITHWCLHRDQRTIQANRIYCSERDRHTALHGREP